MAQLLEHIPATLNRDSQRVGNKRVLSSLLIREATMPKLYSDDLRLRVVVVTAPRATRQQIGLT
jgi:hypothetical protein